MARLPATAALAAALARGAAAWGVDGHATVATVADAFLSPAVNQLLMADLGTESLAKAAIWADDFDHSPEGKWSEALHYINYPGTTCTFDWQRDCANDFCNVGAIANYSKQVWDKNISPANRLVALQLVIHMVGDVHQPLHVASADDRGGNAIRISYDFSTNNAPRSGNLHAAWDDYILVQSITDLTPVRGLRGSPPFHNYKVLSDDLIKKLQGEWSGNATTWKSTVAAAKSDETQLRKGLSVVAGETASAGCDFAYRSTTGELIKSGDLLDEQYYTSRKPVVAVQLAKAGIRLTQILTDALASARGLETIYA